MTRQQLLEIGQRLLDIHRELLQAAEDERQPGATTRQGEDEDEPDDDARSCRLSGDDEARARWMDHKYGRGNW